MAFPAAHPIPPLLLRGPVIKGFGRGSKELGIPTANLDAAVLGPDADACPPGIYYGWARVGAAPETHMMVMSIGWCVAARLFHRSFSRCRAAPHLSIPPFFLFVLLLLNRNPFFKNTQKTVEPHLLHVFPADFYGEELRLVACGYLRAEANFPSLEALMAAIHGDIAEAKARLGGGEPEAAALRAHPFLQLA